LDLILKPTLLGQSVGLMFSLEVQARQLLETPNAPGSPITAGPSYRPG
jgi:hypothetical protein